MASRRSSRILTTTIEVCVDSDTKDQENKKCNDSKNPSTPIAKGRIQNPLRNGVLKQVSQTAPRKRSRQSGNKFEPSKKLESRDMWTRAMMDDVSILQSIVLQSFVLQSIVLQSFVWNLLTVTLTGCPGSVHKGKREARRNDRPNRTVNHYDS